MYAVVFDMDGVILDTENLGIAAWRKRCIISFWRCLPTFPKPRNWRMAVQSNEF